MSQLTNNQNGSDGQNVATPATVFIIRWHKTGKNEVSPRPPVYNKPYEAFGMNMSTLRISKKATMRPATIGCGGVVFNINAIDDAKPWGARNNPEALRLNDEDSAAYRALEAEHARIAKEHRLARETFIEEARKRARRVRKTDCHNVK